MEQNQDHPYICRAATELVRVSFPRDYVDHSGVLILHSTKLSCSGRFEAPRDFQPTIQSVPFFPSHPVLRVLTVVKSVSIHSLQCSKQFPLNVMMDQKIRISISGGGLAGASLFRALLQHAHLDVHIFESAPEFKEAGAAVGTTRNALAALDLMGFMPCLERAGAVSMLGARMFLAEGPGQGKMVFERDRDVEDGGMDFNRVVHRASFLKELLADMPEERMHTSKKLQSVEPSGPDAASAIVLHL